jgi:hypothetical protein
VPTTKSRPGDLTGRVREQQAAALKDELEARAEEIGLATVARRDAELNEITDYTAHTEAPSPRDDSPIDFTEAAGPAPAAVYAREPEEVEIVEVEQPEVVVYMLEELADATIGAGNTRTYKVGQKYKVKAHVAAHLVEKGYAR